MHNYLRFNACRPPFVRIYNEEPIISHGYILQFDFDNQKVSVINLKKGGKISMAIKTVVKALEGFERQFDELNEMKANLEVEKEMARQEALAEVDRKFADKEVQIDKVLATVTQVEEVEVPDEVEVVEESVAEEVPVENEQVESVESDEMNI